MLVLVIALSDLLYNGELGNNYDKDAKRIKCFVILFCSTFSIRAISNIMGIHNNFPFAPSFKNPWFVVLWSLQFLIYNIIPIIYLVKTHHDAFKTKQKSSEGTSTEQITFSSDTDHSFRNKVFFPNNLLKSSRDKPKKTDTKSLQEESISFFTDEKDKELEEALRVSQSILKSKV